MTLKEATKAAEEEYAYELTAKGCFQPESLKEKMNNLLTFHYD